MPSASAELRKLMGTWFGDYINDYGPSKFLLSHGWIEKEGMFFPPVPSHNLSFYEMSCLRFLRDEWDYNFIFAEFTEDFGWQWHDGWGSHGPLESMEMP